MGYMTQYEVSDFDGNKVAFQDKFDEISTYNSMEFFEPLDTMKWYDHEEDITKVMLALANEPDARTIGLKLHGEVEKTGDVWDKVFGLVFEGSADVPAYSVTIETFKYALVRPSLPTEVKSWR